MSRTLSVIMNLQDTGGLINVFNRPMFSQDGLSVVSIQERPILGTQTMFHMEVSDLEQLKFIFNSLLTVNPNSSIEEVGLKQENGEYENIDLKNLKLNR